MRLSVNSNGFSFGVLYAWCAAAPPTPILESPSSSTEPFRGPPRAELLVFMALPGRTFGPFLAAPALAAPKAGGLAFDLPTTILAVLRVLEPGTLLYYELPAPVPPPVVPFDLISKKDL